MLSQNKKVSMMQGRTDLVVGLWEVGFAASDSDCGALGNGIVHMTLHLQTLLLHYYTLFLPTGKVRSADKLQLKAATILPLVGLARSKQDPINRGHGAQYLYRPSPAGAKH